MCSRLEQDAIKDSLGDGADGLGEGDTAIVKFGADGGNRLPGGAEADAILDLVAAAGAGEEGELKLLVRREEVELFGLTSSPVVVS